MKGEIDRALELVRGARQTFADAGLLVSARRGTFARRISRSERGIGRKPSEPSATASPVSRSSASTRTPPPSPRNSRWFSSASGSWPPHARRSTKRAESPLTDDLINFVFIGFAEGRLLAHENRLVGGRGRGSARRRTRRPHRLLLRRARSRTRTSRRRSRSRESRRKPPATRPRRSASWRRRVTSCSPPACESGWLPLAFRHPKRFDPALPVGLQTSHTLSCASVPE